MIRAIAPIRFPVALRGVTQSRAGLQIKHQTPEIKSADRLIRSGDHLTSNIAEPAGFNSSSKLLPPILGKKGTKNFAKILLDVLT